jgi:hypothetical protein
VAIINNFEVGRIDGSKSTLDVLLDEKPMAKFFLNEYWPVISSTLKPGDHRLEFRADILSEAGQNRGNCVDRVAHAASYRPRIALMKNHSGARIRTCDVIEIQDDPDSVSKNLAGDDIENICAAEAGINIQSPAKNISASALQVKKACLEKELAL